MHLLVKSPHVIGLNSWTGPKYYFRVIVLPCPSLYCFVVVVVVPLLTSHFFLEAGPRE